MRPYSANLVLRTAAIFAGDFSLVAMEALADPPAHQRVAHEPTKPAPTVEPRVVLDLLHAHYHGNLIHERINVTVNRWPDPAAAPPISEAAPPNRPASSRSSAILFVSVQNGPLLLRAGRLAMQWHDGAFAAAAAPPTDPDIRPVFVLPARSAQAEPDNGAATPSASSPQNNPLPDLIERIPLPQIRLLLPTDHPDFAQPAALPELRIAYHSAVHDRAASPPVYRLSGTCAITGAAAHLEADARTGRLIRSVLRIPISRLSADDAALPAEDAAPPGQDAPDPRQTGRGVLVESVSGGVVDLVTTASALPVQSPERLIRTYGIDLDPARPRIGDIRELFTRP